MLYLRGDGLPKGTSEVDVRMKNRMKVGRCLYLGSLNPSSFLLSVGDPELPHAVPEGAGIYAQQLRGPR